MQPALRTYLTKLREDAGIDIRAGYVDSGASPKQTKMVFTAYAPPVAKKKTVQEKKRFDRGTKFSTAKTRLLSRSATCGSRLYRRRLRATACDSTNKVELDR